MSYEQILCDVSDGVAVITLNRPKQLNAYTGLMGLELAQALRRCDEDDAVRAVIVTGAGRAFCAGADLSGGGATFDSTRQQAYEEQVRQERAVRVRPWEMKKPIIAAINGHAVGVGITMALQWDIRIAAASAKIAFAFVRRGVIPEALSTWILPRLVGVSRAAEVLYSGRTMLADEALAYGILSRVVPDADVMPTARALAEDIARNAAPVSVALAKRLIWHNLTEPDMYRAEEIETRLFAWSGKQPDAYEGVTAFLQKRAPQWKMKPSTDLPEFVPGKPTKA